eukprot:CAMPEP_0182569746 /NCGR_PEP_ID=MMETSP1324-20130603/10283_1 /TAXON_ID=236786 /ORGANISM="Florenciella sp., Strain RCC1587" /LENGTH=96 /DNA_ID=CAMNT_0024784059 /DNA_START=45 /DNA_END=335 /DNA_ORIENTATION=+
MLESELPSKVEEWVMSELQASETVNYLATLESKVAQRDEQMQAQARAYQNLKSAYEALQRKAQGQGKSKRPGTAGASGRRGQGTALRATTPAAQAY